MGVAADSASASQELCMRIALEMARRGMAAGGPPVGACIVRSGQLLSRNHNAVISELDITAHAEIVCIRAACRELRRLSLEGCELYVTVEPCPMCLAACHYAGIDTIYYGAPISAMHAVTGAELLVATDTLFAQGRQPRLIGGLLADESTTLLEQWASRRGAHS